MINLYPFLNFREKLLTAIKANDLCFNIENTSQDVHGESNVDVIVEKMAMLKDV